MRRLVRPAAYLGALGIVLSLSKAHASVVADNPYDFTSSFRFVWALAYAGLLAVSAYGAGLPDEVRGVRHAAVAAVGASVAAALGMSSVQLVAGDALLPRFVVFGAAVACVPWWAVCATAAAGGRAAAEERDRVVLVVSAAEAEAVRSELAASPERAATVVGVVDPSVAVGGGVRPVEDLVESSGASVVVLDRSAAEDASVVAQAGRLHERGVRVRTLSGFYEEWFAKLPIWELERSSLLFDIGEVHHATYGRVKRLGDLSAGFVGMVALVAITPLVALGDVLANRGPLLYRQRRVGKGGEPFEILKFRTMRAVDGPSHWTAADDDRITPFGRLLRRTHLDELPQVVNILRGELSVVGPRPEQPQYVAELAEALPFYELRHLVRPGLTGWAQVKYHYGADVGDAREKLQYEFWYLRHQSLSLDVRIVARTLRSVVGQEGR